MADDGRKVFPDALDFDSKLRLDKIKPSIGFWQFPASVVVNELVGQLWFVRSLNYCGSEAIFPAYGNNVPHFSTIFRQSSPRTA